MSSPDIAESQEDFIRNLKEAAAAEAHHAANGDATAEVTANGNGVDRDGVSNGNGVDHHDGVGHSKPSMEEVTPEPEAAPSTPKPEEEAPSTPEHEETHATTQPEEPAPEHHQESVIPDKTTPEPQEDEEQEEQEAPVDSAQPEDDAPQKEESLAPAGHEDEVPAVPVTRMRDEWMAKRQSSLDMKREVEAQSRPVLSKAAMSTSVDEQSVRGAYEAVRSDTSDTEWAVFKFQDQKIVCADTGVGFDSFRGHFADGDRAFGYIRIQMGDEMSKRQKFVFLTWVGPAVSVIRRAKMSIDKAMVKNIVKNFAVELQVETQAEINVEYFREQLARAGGANYGTGFRD